MTRSASKGKLAEVSTVRPTDSRRAPASYRIVVRGEMTERFAEVLEDVVVESAGEASLLRVENADPARLQSVLAWLYDHGVELVSLRRCD